jgi:hypothetical protein
MAHQQSRYHFKQMSAIFVVLFALQLCHPAFAIVTQNGVQHTQRSERSSSPTLPILPTSTGERKTQQHKVKRHVKDPSRSNTGDNSGSLPDRIPSLSEVMQDTSLDRPKKPSEESETARVNKTSSRNGRQPKKADKIKSSAAPWRAGFKASIRTQGRIKKAFTSFSRNVPPNVHAKKILQALLATPPKQCNAANIVCALTYSAKAMGMKKHHPDEELRQMLLQTLDVLHKLVNERRLSTRQLANACWAIAKHYDRDDGLLPTPPKMAALSSDSIVGTAETWNMNDPISKEKEQQHRLSETLDEIARQLVSIIEEPDQESHGFVFHQPKIGELCMTSWAFGILRHRSIPPGWQVPPQIGKLTLGTGRMEQPASNSNMITFERWGSFGEKEQEKLGPTDSLEITDTLFNSIAASLCSTPDQGEVTVNDDDEQSRKPSRTFLEQCTWSELANVGWAFASRGSCKSAKSEKLLVSLAREACHRMNDGGIADNGFLIRDIAQLLWSLGTLQADNFRLADDLVYLVEALSRYLRLDASMVSSFGRGRPLRKWNCADIVQVTSSLAHARIDEMPLLWALFQESNYRLTEGLQESNDNSGERRKFHSWEVSILLWAQARLYLNVAQGTVFEGFAADASKFFLQGLSKQKEQSLPGIGIGPQEQANIVWALTVLEQHQSTEAITLIDCIYKEAARECRKQQTIQLEHAHQLWQGYFLMEEESPESIENVPRWFSEYLREKWSLEKARDKMSSARHRALSQTLLFMGVDHYNEHDEDIDVAIVLKGNAEWTHETKGADAMADRVSVAVEFDGPNHFTRERDVPDTRKPPKPRALGHTVLKYRLLKKQGWSVVRVPYYEFDKIPFWASMVSHIEQLQFYFSRWKTMRYSRNLSILLVYFRRDKGIYKGSSRRTQI